MLHKAPVKPTARRLNTRLLYSPSSGRFPSQARPIRRAAIYQHMADLGAARWSRHRVTRKALS